MARQTISISCILDRALRAAEEMLGARMTASTAATGTRFNGAGVLPWRGPQPAITIRVLGWGDAGKRGGS